MGCLVLGCVGGGGGRGAAGPGPAPYLLVCSLGFLFFSFGVLRVEYAEETSVTSLAMQVGQEVVLEGEVLREPEQRASSLHVYVDIEDTTILAFTDRYADITYGDRVQVSGQLRAPEAFETDLGRTFNYPDWLRARGVTHTVSFAQVEVIEQAGGNPLIATLLTFKQSLIASFSQAIPEPQAGLGAGLLLGVKQALGEGLESAFRSTGIIHIVVLSGYNVMIVAEAIMRLLAVVLSVRARVVVGIAAIAGFAVMVGLTATVVRASIMAAIVLVARATGRLYATMRALLLAGFVMLLINPYLLLYDPGFQLSFLATMGLILVAPHIEQLIGFVPTRLQVREFVTATISTQIFVLPLLLYLIGEFSVVAVLVNVLVLPMVPLAMGLVFLTGLVGYVSSAAALLLGMIANISLSYIILTAEWFATLPFASYVVPQFPFWVVIVAYAGMGYFLYTKQYRSRHESLVDGWTIEEETENGGSQSEPPPETPAFFR
ncbi:MAG: ComEC/Rec2 family competence protein [Patescibacteria group bacterium]